MRENAVVRKLDSNNKVESWKFISKKIALDRMKERHPELTNRLLYNPLPASLEVTLKDRTHATKLVASLRSLPGVQRVALAPSE